MDLSMWVSKYTLMLAQLSSRHKKELSHSEKTAKWVKKADKCAVFLHLSMYDTEAREGSH